MPKDQSGRLIPGRIAPLQEVPREIVRPEYVGKSAPAPHTTGDKYDLEIISRIRRASKIAARALEKVLESPISGY